MRSIHGNAETSKDIRISTRFPDTDAETPTTVFAHGLGTIYGLTVTPSLLKILASSPGFREYAVKSFRFDGTAVTLTEILKSTSDISPADFEYANGDYFFHTGGSGLRRYPGDTLLAGINYAIASALDSVIHTRLGVTVGVSISSPLQNFIRYKAYNNEGVAVEIRHAFEYIRAPRTPERSSLRNHGLPHYRCRCIGIRRTLEYQ